jgi:hypothetical protein
MHHIQLEIEDFRRLPRNLFQTILSYLPCQDYMLVPYLTQLKIDVDFIERVL